MVLLDLVRLIPSQVQSSQVRAPFFIHDTKKRESPRLDGSTVRRVLERLATIARSRGDGFGPLHRDDLAEGFKQVCGYEVDEGSYVIIQRMPGLGVIDPVDGSRHFVDADLGDAARAGDLIRFIQDPSLVEDLSLDYMSLAPVGELGLDVAELEAGRKGMDASNTLNAAVQLERGGRNGAIVLASGFHGDFVS